MIKKQYRVGLLSLLMAAGLSMGTLAEELPGVVSETQTERTAGIAETADSAQTEAPATEAPATEAPTEAPATEAPTEAPATEAPATEGMGSETQTEPGQTETPPADGDSLLDGSEGAGGSTEGETSGEGQTETGGTDAETLENQEAFDLIIIEDENGTMEQETTEPTTETETESELPEGLEEDGEQTKEEGDDIDFTVANTKVTRWGESLVDFQSYPVGDLSQNQAKVYRFLRETMNLNKAAASGVLANMESESAFSPVAVGDGGTSYGLCQWHAGRFSNLVAWCDQAGYNYHLLDGQLAYMKWELENVYPGVLSYLRNVTDTARGAYQAGYYWCMYYESPSDTVNRSIYRGKVAMHNYFPVDLDGMEDQAEKWERKRFGGRALQLLDDMLLIYDPEEHFSVATEFCLHIDLGDDLRLSEILEEDLP